MSETVNVTRRGEVAVITFDNPPVNALSRQVQEGIQSSLRAAAEDPEVRALVIIGGGRSFSAGADIGEIEKVTSGQRPVEGLLPLGFLLTVEDCPKPVVMAIRGAALGGGLELAMAGHYRVSEPAAELGQSEVKLGLIPGAAGTQRLPRLAGVAKAVEMCAFGEPVTAREALAP